MPSDLRFGHVGAGGVKTNELRCPCDGLCGLCGLCGLSSSQRRAHLGARSVILISFVRFIPVQTRRQKLTGHFRRSRWPGLAPRWGSWFPVRPRPSPGAPPRPGQKVARLPDTFVVRACVSLKLTKGRWPRRAGRNPRGENRRCAGWRKGGGRTSLRLAS